MNNRIISYLIGITVALLLPFSVYFFVKILKRDKIVQPLFYNIESVSQTTKDGRLINDTIYHKMSEIPFMNQVGDTVLLNSTLNEKMLLLQLINSTQDSSFNTASHNVSYFLRKAFSKNDSTVQFVTLSLDATSDSISQLKTYAQKYNANSDLWWFVIGNSNSVKTWLKKDLATDSYLDSLGKLTLVKKNPTIILIDKQRFVRGYYNLLDTIDLRRCANDIGIIQLYSGFKKK